MICQYRADWLFVKAQYFAKTRPIMLCEFLIALDNYYH